MTRLAKPREARRERTAKANGKENEYEKVYNVHVVDNMQNTTTCKSSKDKETELLQMTKHETQSEIDDERAKIIEILREHFPRASFNGQEQQDRSPEINMVSEPAVYEVNENLNTISVNQVIEMSVQEAEDENMSLHEAEGPGMSKDEYLHESG